MMIMMIMMIMLSIVVNVHVQLQSQIHRCSVYTGTFIHNYAQLMSCVHVYVHDGNDYYNAI